MMNNRLEIFYKFLHDGLQNNTVIVLLLLRDHDRGLPVCPEGCHRTPLQ